jgi:hypothetical protein
MRQIRKTYDNQTNKLGFQYDNNNIGSNRANVVNRKLTKAGFSSEEATIKLGAKSSDGSTSTEISGEGIVSQVISVDPILETFVYKNEKTLQIADGTLTARNLVRDESDVLLYTTEVEVSGDNGFVIRKIDTSGVATPQVYIDTNGNASFAGTLVAPNGTIGGWSISNTRISTTSGGAEVALAIGSSSEPINNGVNRLVFWAGGSNTGAYSAVRIDNAGILEAEYAELGYARFDAASGDAGMEILEQQISATEGKSARVAYYKLEQSYLQLGTGTYNGRLEYDKLSFVGPGATPNTFIIERDGANSATADGRSITLRAPSVIATSSKVINLPDASGTVTLNPSNTAYTNSVWSGNGEWRFVGYNYESANQSLSAATDVLTINIPRAGEYKVFMSGAYYSTDVGIGIQAKFTYTADPGQNGLSTLPDPVFNWVAAQTNAATSGALHLKTGMNSAITTTSVAVINTDHGLSCIGFFRTLGSGTLALNIAPETGSTSVGVAEGTVLYVEELIN